MRTRYPVWALRYWWAACALLAHRTQAGDACTVVDLGCERGIMKRFVPFQDGISWIGLDRAVDHPWLPAAGYQELHACDFDDPLPLPDACADVVISLHVFEHLQRPEFTIRQVQRILRPGGVFLAGTPVHPKVLAKFQEQRFRREMAAGHRRPTGHRHAFWPQRWVDLARDAGLHVEFLNGSHFLRSTGFVLENCHWWIRLNQLWGALFPSLGSEIYLQARKFSP
jgi:SAM-dependent methyltransferase